MRLSVTLCLYPVPLKGGGELGILESPERTY